MPVYMHLISNYTKISACTLHTQSLLHATAPITGIYFAFADSYIAISTFEIPVYRRDIRLHARTYLTPWTI